MSGKYILIILLLYNVFIQTINSQSNSFYKKNIDSLIAVTDISQNQLDVIHQYVLASYMQNDIATALTYSLVELQLYKKAKINTVKQSNVIYNIALFYYKQQYYYKSITYLTTYLSSKYADISKAYNFIGLNYYNLGNYSKALYHYKKALIQNQNKKTNKDFDIYINMFDIYEILNKPEKQWTVLRQIDTLKTKYQFSRQKHYILNNNYALYYLNNTENLAKVKMYYLKNLDTALKNKDSLVVSATYINLGNLYTRQKKDSAIYFFNTALRFDKSYKTRYFSNLAHFYNQKKDYLKALRYVEQSIEGLESKSRDFQDKSLLILDKGLKMRIYIEMYKANQHTASMQKALSIAKSIDTLVDAIKTDVGANSVSFWQEEVLPIYSKAIYCCKESNNPILAAYYFEKSKAIVLLHNTIQKQVALNFPRAVLEKETALKKEINQLQMLLDTSYKKDSIQTVLFAVQERFSMFKDSITQRYPKYNHFDTSLLTLPKIQQQLKANDVVLSYNWVIHEDTKTNALFELIITSHHVELLEIAQPEQLQKKLIHYAALLKQPLQTKKDQNAYKKVAYHIYQHLFPKTLQTTLHHKNVTILPDGLLQNIPFEALITKENTLEYLLKTSTVNYGYSMSFLAKNNSIQRHPKKTVLGIAPVHFKKDLSTLPYSAHEVKHIQSLFNGGAVLNTQATKAFFTTHSNEYKYIHLATHADANTSTTPWIAFKNEKLYLDELYTLNTQADLVTLSACNTSIGKIVKGEGVLSLARGFFYSGSKSVLSSLWYINDKSSSDIMIDFYKNLKKGDTKSKSLQLAKLNYLKTHTLSEASPYYWASFVLIGDAGELANNSSFIWVYVLLGFVLVLLVWVVKRKIATVVPPSQ